MESLFQKDRGAEGGRLGPFRPEYIGVNGYGSRGELSKSGLLTLTSRGEHTGYH